MKNIQNFKRFRFYRKKETWEIRKRKNHICQKDLNFEKCSNFDKCTDFLKIKEKQQKIRKPKKENKTKMKNKTKTKLARRKWKPEIILFY